MEGFSSRFIAYLENGLSLEKDSIREIKSMKETGASSQNFVIRLSTGEKYVLRTYPGKIRGYSEKEFTILKILSQSKACDLCPKPFLVDSSKTELEDEFLVEDFISGVKIKEEVLKEKKERIIQSGRLLRLVHDSLPKFEECGEELVSKGVKIHRNEYNLFTDIGIIEFGFSWVAQTISKSMKKHSNVSDFSTRANDLIERSFRETKSKIKAPLFKNASRSFIIHGDYHNENLLLETSEDTEKIRVIDWEFARFGNPYEDIAFFICSADLDENEEKMFLKGYFGEDEGVNEELLWIMKVRKYMYVTACLILMCSECKQSKWSCDRVRKFLNKTEELFVEEI